MLKQEISMRTMHLNESIIDALKKMDESGYRSLLVIDDTSQFCGILSLGDIQRAILKNIPLDSNIGGILRKNPKVASKDTSFDEVKLMMLQYRMEFLPVIDEYNNVIKSFFWDEVFGVEQKIPVTPFNLPIVIMAGGFGSRLRPLTNVIPKPLIPIGEKTMLEEIFERFGRYGCKSFNISVNYKAELIEYYIDNLKLPYDINYFKEEKPLGTAGSLHMLKGIIKSTFFVTNCDILIEQDYSEILEYHNEKKNDITIVAALKHYPIPYGTIETGEEGNLINLTEKPELTFKINSGMYILEPETLNSIPEGEFFHITQLIEIIKNNGGRVGVYPVSQSSWKDVGDFNEYFKTLSK